MIMIFFTFIKMNKLKYYFNSKRFDKPILKQNPNEPQPEAQWSQQACDLYGNKFEESDGTGSINNPNDVNSINENQNSKADDKKNKN